MTREIVFTYLITYIVAASIEFLVIYLFIRRIVAKVFRLYQSVLLVNLITFPLTQALAYYLAYTFYNIWRVYYFAEIVPFGSEYFLLKWQFNLLLRKGSLKEPVTNKKIFVMMILANLLTFVLGILYFEVI